MTRIPPSTPNGRRCPFQTSPKSKGGPNAYPCLLALFIGLQTAPAGAADELPPVWGYGVQTCGAFVTAADGRDQGAELQTLEYGRYEDWLTGFVTGLNLATGQDVLVGAGIDGAMRRIQAHCRGNRGQDFFTAAMDLIRMLSGLK